jgi:thiamine-phosphate pyrophosphorylase
MILPRLYAIADVGVLRTRGIGLEVFAKGLRAAGVSLVQLRDKEGSPQEVLEHAAVLREVFEDGCLLIMNDRADLAVVAEFDGVHVGQGDLSVSDVRRVLGQTHSSRWGRDEWGTRLVGLSTHSVEQFWCCAEADYLAVGPVFATGTKLDAEPVVGLDGVRRARGLTAKPLVAIGGITRENCRSVIEAGADSVAVISGLIVPGESVEKVARDFLAILG